MPTCRQGGVQRVREAFAAVTFAPPFRSARLTLSGLKTYHDRHPISQPDKHPINIRLIHHFLRRGMWIIPDFSVCTGMTRALPGKCPLLVPAGRRIPSISTAYAQDWRRCAQVIHMFVHRQQGAAFWSAGRPQRIGTGRRYSPARANAPRARIRDWLVPSPPRPGRDRRPAAAGFTSPAGGSQAAPSSAPT
jgi:hypothetical protein